MTHSGLTRSGMQKSCTYLGWCRASYDASGFRA